MSRRVQVTKVEIPEEVVRYAHYRDDLIGFAKDVLKFHFTPQQVEASKKLHRPPYRVLVPAGNEVGKTAWAAAAVLHWFCTRSPAIIITTAPRLESVKGLLWKEVRKLARHIDPPLPFQPKDCRIERAPDDFAVGTTARDATSFHGHHGPNMLFVFDEANGVTSDFWEATETMFSPPGHAWACLYNPTMTSGQDYVEYTRAQSAERKGETAPWAIERISAREHPNIDAELKGEKPPIPYAIRLAKFDRLLRSWSQLVAPGTQKASDVQWPPEWAKAYIERTGRKPRWYKPGPLAEARLLGRYPSQGINSVWSDGDWIAATREGLEWLSIPFDAIPEIGCDVATMGDDFTSIHVRQHFSSLHHETANGWRETETAGKLIELARHYAFWFNKEINPVAPAIRPRPITEFMIPLKIDDAPVGGGVIAILLEQGYNVIPICASHVPFEPKNYPNRRSELWFNVAEMARDDELDLSRLDAQRCAIEGWPQPADPGILDELHRQLMSPTWEMDSRGRRVVEPKDATKSRLGRSPDDADALNLAYAPGVGNVAPPSVGAKRSDPAGDQWQQQSNRRGKR